MCEGGELEGVLNMVGKLPLPESDQELITIEEVYARWSKLQGLTLIQFCRLMNGYHRDQDLVIYLRETKTSVRVTKGEMIHGRVNDMTIYGEFSNFNLPTEVLLSAVNNKKKQMLHESIYNAKFDSITDDRDEALLNKEYKEAERLRRKAVLYGRVSQQRFWDVGEPERVIIVIDYHDDDNQSHLMSTWSFLYLKRAELEAFEERNDVFIAKDKVVRQEFSEETESSTVRVQNQAFPFTAPPVEGRQDAFFDLMEHCFAEFFREKKVHVTKKETWGVVIKSIKRMDVPSHLRELVNLIKEGRKDVINHVDAGTLEQSAFMARIRSYNK